MQPLALAIPLLLITASLLGCIEELEGRDTIIDCDTRNLDYPIGYSHTSYEVAYCEPTEYQMKGNKKENKTSRQDEYEYENTTENSKYGDLYNDSRLA